MSTETEAALIVQVPRGGAVDRNWREDELAVALDAANRSHRLVILRVIADA